MICPHCNQPIKDSLVISESQKLLASKTSEAKKISSANNGFFGGKPRSKNPSKAALYQRQYRSKKVTAKKT